MNLNFVLRQKTIRAVCRKKKEPRKTQSWKICMCHSLKSHQIRSHILGVNEKDSNSAHWDGHFGLRGNRAGGKWTGPPAAFQIIMILYCVLENGKPKFQADLSKFLSIWKQTLVKQTLVRLICLWLPSATTRCMILLFGTSKSNKI